ncbi:hypothetical protein [Nocardia arthritidis]|uniref:Uncharacterized protein n=1 Tax=Nocardia arthritidis TaxID=228602 RepID=A0A6G9Y9M3_9NOCA|nr:hypothetical protein [Nocardia arthritidis]QIS09922.1 hypothetical protein F5544_10115 [Nocardia arthritidis]
MAYEGRNLNGHNNSRRSRSRRLLALHEAGADEIAAAQIPVGDPQRDEAAFLKLIAEIST